MRSDPHAAANDPSSRGEIDIGDKAALNHWAEALGTTAEALESAVQAVGTRIDRIKDFLTGQAADQGGA